MMQLLYVTCSDVTEARNIARKIVEDKLAACGNILPAMESVYKWEGEIEFSQESVLLLKTSSELLKACIAKVEKLHSYKIPCIVSINVSDGSTAYLNWLKEQII